MPTLYITEYSHLVETARGRAQIPATPPLASQTVTIAAGTAQSAAFNVKTRIIRIHADAAANVEVGTVNPVALDTSARFAAGQTEFQGVTPGEKLAVKTSAA